MTKKRILLVDDEPRATRILRMHLEKTGGYEVKEVNKGSMTLTAARQFKPDFILLDVVMPDMDGGEVAANIAADENLKNVPLVFLTATVLKEEQGIISGYPFIAKPTTGAQVVECIQQYLGPIPAEPTPQVTPSADWKGPRTYLVAILAIFFVGVAYFAYRFYTQSEQSQQQTKQELQETKSELSALKSLATETLHMQQITIDQRKKKALAEENLAIRKIKAIEDRLEETLQAMEKTKVSALSSTSMSSSLLHSIAPSVVKLYCSANSHSDTVQKGTGFLYRAAGHNTQLPLYYVQTNLHVIKMGDRAKSDCRILIYPDYTDSKSYLLYKSQDYQSYGEDVDIAFLEPVIVKNLKGGTRNDLVVYARDESEAPVCDSVHIGEHLSILGYPGVGGETLTVTEGIVSGFELDGRNRYVKTSAKTDSGNSGGVAIKDSGCVVGIPTWSRRGKVESIGRILDLNHLHNETIKYETLR